MGSKGAVLTWMGRSFHHWGAKVEKLCSQDKQEPFSKTCFLVVLTQLCRQLPARLAFDDATRDMPSEGRLSSGSVQQQARGGVRVWRSDER